MTPLEFVQLLLTAHELDKTTAPQQLPEFLRVGTILTILGVVTTALTSVSMRGGCLQLIALMILAVGLLLLLCYGMAAKKYESVALGFAAAAFVVCVTIVLIVSRNASPASTPSSPSTAASAVANLPSSNNATPANVATSSVGTSDAPTKEVVPGGVIAPKPVFFPPVPEPSMLRTLTVEYDKFKDQWMIAAESVQLQQDKPVGPYDIRSRPIFMNLRAAVVRQGQYPAALSGDSDIALVVTSVAFEWQFINDHTLWLIADDQRHAFETVRSSQTDPITETLVVTLSLERFLEIVSADAVVGKIGNQQFTVTRASLVMLRAFGGALQLYPYDIVRRAAIQPTPAQRAGVDRSDRRLASADSSRHDDTQANAAAATVRPNTDARRPWVEQVYVDQNVSTFYPENCSPRPARAVRLPKSIAIQKGYALAPQCRQP